MIKWLGTLPIEMNKVEKKNNILKVFSLRISSTNNFDYDNKLGESDFQNVYWSHLRDGSEIDVKILKV